MIIYLYGPDSYQRQEKLHWYINEFIKKYSNLTIERFDLELEEDRPKFKDFSVSQSLFGEVKLGIAENIRSAEPKEVLPVIKSILEEKSATLIISEKAKLAKEYDFLLKAHTVQAFPQLSFEGISDFLNQETRKRHLVLDQKSQNLLIGVYGSDTWGLVTELDKLALLDTKDITREVLEKHLDVSLPLNIYNTLSRIQNTGNIGWRLSLLEEIFFRSSDPGMVFNILSTLVQTPADKQKMADYDAAVKSGKLEYEEAILSYLIS